MDVPLWDEETAALQGLQAVYPQIPSMAILQTFKACGSDASMAANLRFDSYRGASYPHYVGVNAR